MEFQEKLGSIKGQLDKNEQVEPITVRTLLNWYGAERRGWWVVEGINRALKHFGIETRPHFDSTYIDGAIQFFKCNPEQEAIPFEIAQEVNTVGAENIVEKDGDKVHSSEDPTYRIAKLEAANKDLKFVKPDSELSEAITIMITYDFSQLPVMQQSKRDLKGVISWRSIGSKIALGQLSTKVRDLMEPNYQLISYGTSLFKALPIIIEYEYVLVENTSKEISGIVTASDLSLQFQQLTEPFLLVAEIENHLRHILSSLGKEDIVAAKDPEDTERIIESVADLTFGEYLRLFQNPTIWDKLTLKVDRKTYCAHLDKIKVIRNNIMHFDPDGLDVESIETLRRFARLLQTLRRMKLF